MHPPFGVVFRLGVPGPPCRLWPCGARRAWPMGRAWRKRLRSPCSGICRRNAALVLLQTSGILSSARSRAGRNAGRGLGPAGPFGRRCPSGGGDHAPPPCRSGNIRAMLGDVTPVTAQGQASP
nr:hypothetical protein RVX_0344 [Nitratidesulfovibrio sp. HK-II]